MKLSKTLKLKTLLVTTLTILIVFIFFPYSKPVSANNDEDAGLFGNITLPTEFKYGELTGEGGVGGGLIGFLNNIIRLLIVVGGLFAFFNLILAGYGFLSAGDDPKKMAAAWAKIWQSMMGLLFILGSFVLAAIFGFLLFGSPTAILQPQLYGP